MKRAIGLCTLLLCVLSVSAQASVVYSQLYTTPLGTEFLSDLHGSGGQIIADNFTIDHAVLITDVHWWGVYDGAQLPAPPPTLPAADNFTIKFFNVNLDNSLDGLIATFAAGDVGRVPTGIPVLNTQLFSYGYALSNPTSILITANAKYAVEIYNNTAAGNWRWQTAGAGSSYVNGVWPGFGLNLAFTLTDDVNPNEVLPVPEPVTCLLFGGSVLMGLGRLRRKLR